MTKSIYILLLFLVWQYSAQQNNTVYYIYDSENILKRQETESVRWYWQTIPVYTSWGDSMTFEISKKQYVLMHFYEEHDGYPKDSACSKDKSFLKSINYYDSDWLKKEENLKQFWDYSMYEFGGREDTLEIYLIHKIPDTDSIKLEQVHRFYVPNREG